MIVSKEKYCITSKNFPLKFYHCGEETDELGDDVLKSKEYCENELETYDEPEAFQILKVRVTYEL